MINLIECCRWQGYFTRGIQAVGQELEGRGCVTEDRTDRIMDVRQKTERDKMKELCGIAMPQKVEMLLPRIEPRKSFYGKFPHCQ